VVTAVGKGYTTYSKVLKVFKKKKSARFLTFHTESGYKIEVTDNHKMFCFIPPYAHHFSLDAVNRGNKARVKIHLEMCYRKNSLKSSRDKPLKNPSDL